MDHRVRHNVGETGKLSPMHLWLSTICHVGDEASECKIGLFQGADFAGDLTDAKSTSGGMVLCVFRDHTLVQRSWDARNRRECPTEAEVVSLDTGERMEGLIACVDVVGHCN